MTYKVFIENGFHAYTDLFVKLGFKVVNTIGESDVVVFTGGADVDPSLYNHKQHPRTFYNTNRDMAEKEIYQYALNLGKAFVGICRGGQFLNVMNGGTMYQDVTLHTRDHVMVDVETGQKLLVSSTHHQMMNPADNAIIIAEAPFPCMAEYYEEGNMFVVEQLEKGIEVVLYPNTRSLCFQPHPEFVGPKYEEMQEYFKGLVLRLLT